MLFASLKLCVAIIIRRCLSIRLICIEVANFFHKYMQITSFEYAQIPRAHRDAFCLVYLSWWRISPSACPLWIRRYLFAPFFLDSTTQKPHNPLGISALLVLDWTANSSDLPPPLKMCGGLWSPNTTTENPLSPATTHTHQPLFGTVVQASNLELMNL